MLSNQKELTGPSGFKYTITEQNGEHDAILSNRSLQENGNNFDLFVSQIVVKTDITASGILTLDDIQKIPSLDFAFIIFASRIFSIGKDLRYTYNWGDQSKPNNVKYLEDLSNYTPDFSDILKVPKYGEDGYFHLACPFYPQGKNRVIEFTTSSGKLLRYNILSRGGEKKLLEIDPKNHTINTKLILRNLEFKADTEFYSVKNFKDFTTKDMNEIRNNVNKNDPDWSALSEIRNPTTNEIRYIDILGIPDFFFPAEI